MMWFMDFHHSPHAHEVLAEVQRFCEQYVLPLNREITRQVRMHQDFSSTELQRLRAEARALGLWNFALTELAEGEGMPLRHTDYALVAEYLGRVLWSSQVFNCQWPDVPNMVALQAWADDAQRARWLEPLLGGTCHSAFAMTEPERASSDANNIATRIRRDGDEYVISGEKWYISGAAHPGCRFYMLLGVTDADAPRNARHSVVMVPRDAEGLHIGPRSSYLGFTEPMGAAHRLRFDAVRVPVDNRIGAEGQGFQVAQARLAPARLHHCMRAVGQCELLIELMLLRARERRTFGDSLAERDSVQAWIAQSRVDTEQARLLVQRTAWRVDQMGAQAAFRDLAVLKVGVAQAYHRVAERAAQLFGAMGGHQAGPVAEALAWSRAFRIADGPDEVHLRSIFAREEAPAGSLAGSPYMPEPESF